MNSCQKLKREACCLELGSLVCGVDAKIEQNNFGATYIISIKRIWATPYGQLFISFPEVNPSKTDDEKLMGQRV